ncbi:sugar transferase [Clostridium perfringens]|uniref:Bacterial sugar transferase family protein n=1 Tax=Clostridium perfringens (strain ATCC 13124 / DSM 756 / JCM 1290 / NCIMB 6125 / NCTC 8237 / Type A) TaxID=195103 RepID=A0A0H2YQ98_CLOP1|nr:sugar transferase [Clostridium perfringens]ABG83056.1 bacterial sugar transferase family protein [Clostridium perfringens ATCC 13124]MBI5991360.1 sugar transferase [Clostridium perfringens]MDU7548621.1 sugar transferase [Clostridium perfringens]
MLNIAKRTFDLFFSLIGIIITIPIFILVSIMIKLTSKGPIIFKQERVGKNKKIFYIYKLRTMTDCDVKASDRQVTVINDQRITRIGRILRKYKIDELPQLYNVLKGDMSFVGPRPEVKKYVKFYEEEYDEILKIKPGITDLASIEYIDENTIISKYSDPEKVYIEEVLPKKLMLNKRYIEEMSIKNDILLILKTIKKIIN